MRPNIVYLHTHDAGRYIEPYGYAVPTPNLMRFARESFVFRNMHCAAPVCTASRVAMLTGRAPHSTGVLGLAHRGWPLQDTSQHLVHQLGQAGYRTVLSGTQHEHTDATALGYHEVLRDTWGGAESAPGTRIEDAAADFLRGPHEDPFFLSVGFNTTHRTFPDPLPADDEAYCRPPAPLPDNAVTRRDMACYRRAAAILDAQMGRVLQAIDDAGLRDTTLVICTTDHGLAFPHMKCTLTDHGTGVFFMLRWPERIRGGQVSDALVSQIDLYPTLCEWLGLAAPAQLQGNSLAPVIADPRHEINDAVYSEVTYHAATEIMRAVRTPRWLYIRRWDPRLRPVGPNTDVSYSKQVLVAAGLAGRTYAGEELYDCVFDPQQRNTLAADPAHAQTLDELRARLQDWMARTGDPLCDGVAALPPNPMPRDPDEFGGNIGGAPLPPLPTHLR